MGGVNGEEKKYFLGKLDPENKNYDSFNMSSHTRKKRERHLSEEWKLKKFLICSMSVHCIIRNNNTN
jgi:hypothetical protein